MAINPSRLEMGALTGTDCQFSDKTKLVAITHMSNVLGTVVDVKTICHEARKRGIVSLVDGSQAAVHMSVNVKDIGCDFYAITPIFRRPRISSPTANSAWRIGTTSHREEASF